jgi:hypothetical protein
MWRSAFVSNVSPGLYALPPLLRVVTRLPRRGQFNDSLGSTSGIAVSSSPGASAHARLQPRNTRPNPLRLRLSDQPHEHPDDRHWGDDRRKRDAICRGRAAQASRKTTHTDSEVRWSSSLCNELPRARARRVPPPLDRSDWHLMDCRGDLNFNAQDSVARQRRRRPIVLSKTLDGGRGDLEQRRPLRRDRVPDAFCVHHRHDAGPHDCHTPECSTFVASSPDHSPIWSALFCSVLVQQTTFL